MNCAGWPTNAGRPESGPRRIAADWGVTSRDIRYWVEWYRRRLPAEEADWPAHLRRCRRWMLELRNAGHSHEAIGQRYGISAQTVGYSVRQALSEIGPDERIAGPVLDWVRERLSDEPYGLALETLQAQVDADAAMGHPVCRKLLRQVGRQVWQGGLCRPAEVDAAALRAMRDGETSERLAEVLA